MILTLSFILSLTLKLNLHSLNFNPTLNTLGLFLNLSPNNPNPNPTLNNLTLTLSLALPSTLGLTNLILNIHRRVLRLG